MFTSKVYTVSIPSSGIVLEEERIAREVISKWRIENGEKTGIVLLPIPSDDKEITPDIYVMPIDNYIDIAKANAIMATGKHVILLFSEKHDEKNTISAELKVVEVLRNSKDANCIIATFNGNNEFQQKLVAAIEQTINR